MPFLLLDDATDFLTGRLQQFGDGVLQALTTPPVDPNVVQRLQDYGQAQLQNLSQVGVGLPQPPQIDSSAITSRLQDFGQNLLTQAQQAQQPPPTIQQAPQVLQQPDASQGLGGASSDTASGGVSGLADVTASRHAAMDDFDRQAQQRLDQLDAAIRAVGGARD